MDGTSQLVRKQERKSSEKKDKKRDVLNDIQQHMANFDLQQKKVACVDRIGPQRIRGLAGSGKTIILTQKAALFHLRHPEKKILYTYYTKALCDSVKDHIRRSYKYFIDNNEAEPNWGNITVCHGWGSNSSPGVYSKACEEHGYQMLTYGQACARSIADPLGTAIKELLTNVEIQEKYDLILIDEGQDFTIPFYQLCYKLVRDENITWAYDDFQNIFDVSIQDERETFGKDVKGEYRIDFRKKQTRFRMLSFPNATEHLVIH